MTKMMSIKSSHRLLIYFQLWHLFLQSETVIGFLKCPGPCMDPKNCREMGGRILGYCVNDKACCEIRHNVWGSCGDTLSNTKISHFRSPQYPISSVGDLVCKFELKLSQSTSGIRLDFLDLKMDSLPFDPLEYMQSPYSLCDSDMMFIKGFKNWSPDPRCGNLTGYSFLVEQEEGQRIISIVFIMSSSDYKWNIKLTEIYDMEVNRLYEIVYNKMSPKSPNPQSQEPTNPDYLVNLPPFPGPILPYPVPGGPPLPFKSTEPEEVINTGLDFQEVYEPLPRIAGGENAEPNAIPWQVSIQSIEHGETNLCGPVRNMSIHLCGGSIIDHRTIITASHCFFSSSRYPHPTVDVKDLKIVVGELDMCNSDEVPFTKDYSISAVILHYNYISTEIINDLAIIQLSQSIEFNTGVQPIALASKDLNFGEITPLLSGWGSYGVSDNSSFPPSLQMTSNLILFSTEECTETQRAYLNYNLPESNLPGKYQGVSSKGICVRGKNSSIEAGYGDSGGPLVALNLESSLNESPRQLIGIVSHMRPELDAGTNTSFNLDYFTKVSAYKKWILMGMVPV